MKRLLLGAWVLSLAALASPPAGAADPKPANANSNPVYAQLRGLELSGESVQVENLTLQRDVATFTFVNGVFHLARAVDGRITGAVFVGDGRIEVNPHLDVEKRHMKWLTDSGSFGDTFATLVIRFTDDTLAELTRFDKPKPGGADGRAAGAWKSARELFREGRQYINPNLAVAFLEYNLELRLLTDLLWPGQGGYFHAFGEGKQYGDFLFLVDPLGAPFVAPEEVVLVALKEGNLGVWMAERRRGAYTGQTAAKADLRLVDVEHYRIDASARDKNLKAKVTVSFKALVEGARVLPLDLFAKLRVTRVADGQDRELEFVQEDKDEDANFGVILAEGLRRGETYRLTFEYAGDDAVQDMGGGNFTLLARSNWYPSNGFGDRATYDMTLRSPKELVMVATGQLQEEKKEGDELVTRWKSDTPLAVAGFNYGRFKKTVVHDEKINYSIETYANRFLPDDIQGLIKSIEEYERQTGQSTGTTLGNMDTTKLMDKARAEAQLSMQLYTDMFGPLPYGRLAMTQQPYPNFGQAWPMLVYMPITAFLDSTYRAQLGMTGAASFFRYVAAHEVSHQWWGHIVGWDSYRDQWLSEGIAELSASLFAQVVYKNDKFIEFWEDLRRDITQKNDKGRRPLEVGSVTMGYRLNTAKTGFATQQIIYSKGAFILQMLRMLMWDPKTGDQRFSAMMRDFIQTHHNQNVATDDFKRAVEKHLTPEMNLAGNGRMDWFFDQWVYGTELPDYKLDYRLEPADGGRTRLLCKVTQRQVSDGFMMRVPIYIDFDGTLRRLGTVVLTGNSTSPEIDVMLPKKPKRVLLCAFEDVLCSTDGR
jgi:hypothetical protein